MSTVKSNEEKIEEAKKTAKPLDIKMYGNRVAYFNIAILPKNKIGNLILPESIKKDSMDTLMYDQHPKQGILVAMGPEAEALGLKLLDHVYIREMSASYLVIDGITYCVVYGSDILCSVK